MGKTYYKNQKGFDDESQKNGGKHAKHATNRRGQGMKTLNTYVEDDYDAPFVDGLEIDDEIFITHTKHNP